MKFVPWWVRIQNIDERTKLMAINTAKLVEEVANIKTVAAGTAQIVHTIADEIKALRNEAGGALQNQLDALAAELHGTAETLGQANQEGTAAEGETPAPLTSEQVMELQGQKRAAFNPAGQPLLDQTKDGPKDEAEGGRPKKTEGAEDKTQRGHEEGAQFDADQGSAQRAVDHLDKEAKNAP